MNKKTSEYDALRLKNQLCFPLYAAARKITNLYTPFLKPLGLTYTQYLVFMVLWEKDGLTVGELGNCLKLDSGTLTPMLKKLESAGLLLRKRKKEDERIVTIYLTEEGKSLQNKAKDIPCGMKNCLDISEEEAAILYKILYKFLDD